MGEELPAVAFDVVERADVGAAEIERLAQRVWRSMTRDNDNSGDKPRWLFCSPLDPGSADLDSAYVVHRFEGTITRSREV